jgi:hypothetical protein
MKAYQVWTPIVLVICLFISFIIFIRTYKRLDFFLFLAWIANCTLYLGIKYSAKEINQAFPSTDPDLSVPEAFIKLLCGIGCAYMAISLINAAKPYLESEEDKEKIQPRDDSASLTGSPRQKLEDKKRK